MPANILSLIMVLALSCETVIAASDSNVDSDGAKRTVLRALEKEPAASHIQFVQRVFQDAGRVTLRYRAAESMGRAYFGSQEVDEHWQHQVEYRCAYECLGVATDLQSFFASGLRTDTTCPPPIDLVVVFQSHSSGATTKFFANSLSSCFTLGQQSFVVVNENFGFLARFLDKSIVEMF